MPNLNHPSTSKRVKRNGASRRSSAPLTITVVAEEIMASVRAFDQADAASMLANEIAGPTRGPCAGDTARRMSSLADDARRLANVCQDRTAVLEQMMLRMEPRSPSEVFSLALLLVTELDTFVCNHTGHAHDEAARKGGKLVERVLQTVVDGLYHQMKLRSPLDSHYYTAERRDRDRRRRQRTEELVEMTVPEINALIERREREQGSPA